MTDSKQIAGPGRAGGLATPAELRENAREAGRLLASLRRHHRGGRPKKLQTCAYCEKEMGAMELRHHEPRCPVRKRPSSSDRPWNF